MMTLTNPVYVMICNSHSGNNYDSHSGNGNDSHSGNGNDYDNNYDSQS